MGILIKGVKMPKNCDCCPLCKTESAFHGMCQAIRNDICYVYPDKEKPLWCPLVEVPTHGRLIDAGELYEKTAEWEAQALDLVKMHMHDEDTEEWRKWSTVLTERSAFKFDVADAPTVIEASEDVGHCDSCHWRQNVKDPDDLIQDHCEVCEWCEVEQ